MNSFFMAAKVVVPLIIYMLIGWGVRRGRILNRDQMRACNLLIFKVMLPLNLFFNVYSVDLQEVVNAKLFLYCFFGDILFALLAWMVMKHVAENLPDLATLTQGTFRSNFALFGGSIAAALCGAAGNAMVGALTAVIVPTINILSVIVFEKARGGKLKLGHTLLEVIRNPLVVGGMLGLLFSALHWRIPAMFADPLNQLGKATTPVALVLLGGILSADSLRHHMKMIAAAGSLRLVVIPLIALSLGVLIGFRGDELVALVAVFASPTAVASAPMAQVMGGNGALASEIVAVTTVCCVVTIFLFVYTLSATGLIG